MPHGPKSLTNDLEGVATNVRAPAHIPPGLTKPSHNRIRSVTVVSFLDPYSGLLHFI